MGDMCTGKSTLTISSEAPCEAILCYLQPPDRLHARCVILLIKSRFILTPKGIFLMAVAHITQDEQELIEAIRELARERVAPCAAEIDHTAEFPWDMKELLAQQDIYGMPFPIEYGGLGASKLAIVMAIEELS